jgi:hypothetical protein
MREPPMVLRYWYLGSNPPTIQSTRRWPGPWSWHPITAVHTDRCPHRTERTGQERSANGGRHSYVCPT